MCTKNGSYCEKEKKVRGGGQGRCERRSEAFVFFLCVFFVFCFFFLGGGGRVGGQGGCELRSEAFVKIQKKKMGGGGGLGQRGGQIGGGGGVRLGGVQAGREQRSEACVEIFFFGGGGVRVE